MSVLGLYYINKYSLNVSQYIILYIDVRNKNNIKSPFYLSRGCATRKLKNLSNSSLWIFWELKRSQNKNDDLGLIVSP